jgi:hypothetical protein
MRSGYNFRQKRNGVKQSKVITVKNGNCQIDPQQNGIEV